MSFKKDAVVIWSGRVLAAKITAAVSREEHDYGYQHDHDKGLQIFTLPESHSSIRILMIVGPFGIPTGTRVLTSPVYLGVNGSCR